MNSHDAFTHIHQGCFAGTGAIVRLPQCQWSKPAGYEKISQYITTTKHGKAIAVCIFLGTYCMHMHVQMHMYMYMYLYMYMYIYNGLEQYTYKMTSKSHRVQWLNFAYDIPPWLLTVWIWKYLPRCTSMYCLMLIIFDLNPTHKLYQRTAYFSTCLANWNYELFKLKINNKQQKYAF